MVHINIALTPHKSCFECKHALYESNDVGMDYVVCQYPDMTQKKKDYLFENYNEDYLPLHCGHFEYREEDQICHICNRHMDIPTYMNSIYGMLPICSQPCAIKQEEIEDDYVAELTRNDKEYLRNSHE